MPDSPYKTFSNIYTAVLKDFKESTNATMVSMAQRWVNEAQENIIQRKKRDFLNKTYHYTLEAKVETTYSVINNSVVVTKTGTATLPTTSTVEHKFKVQSVEGVYDVASFDASTITLVSPYTGATSTAVTAVFFQSSLYLDADIDEIYKVYHDRLGIPYCELRGYEDFREVSQQDPSRTDYARFASVAGYNNQSVSAGEDKRRLVFYPYPATAYTMHVDAKIFIPPMSLPTDEPIIPIQTRQALYWYAAAKLALFHQDAEAYQVFLSTYNTWLNKLDGGMLAISETPQIKNNNYRWMQRSGYAKRRRFEFES